MFRREVDNIYFYQKNIQQVVYPCRFSGLLIIFFFSLVKELDVLDIYNNGSRTKNCVTNFVTWFDNGEEVISQGVGCRL